MVFVLLALGLWGLFKAFKELKALWRQGFKKDVLKMAGYFGLCPVILAFLYEWQSRSPNLWLVVPLLIASLIWVFSGYLMMVVAQKKLAGKEKPLWAPDQITKKTALYGILFCAGAALWIVGFQGFLVNLSFEEALLILSLYLIVTGFIGLRHVCRSIKNHKK